MWPLVPLPSTPLACGDRAEQGWGRGHVALRESKSGGLLNGTRLCGVRAFTPQTTQSPWPPRCPSGTRHTRLMGAEPPGASRSHSGRLGPSMGGLRAWQGPCVQPRGSRAPLPGEEPRGRWYISLRVGHAQRRRLPGRCSLGQNRRRRRPEDAVHLRGALTAYGNRQRASSSSQGPL